VGDSVACAAGSLGVCVCARLSGRRQALSGMTCGCLSVLVDVSKLPEAVQAQVLQQLPVPLGREGLHRAIGRPDQYGAGR
jgi:hypothetical protein